MSDLISRQDAICAVCGNCLRTDLEVLDGCLGEDCSIKPVLESMPAVDAVEVVRCGNCKHLTADGRCLEFADDSLRPSANDYCSYGERREE